MSHSRFLSPRIESVLATGSARFELLQHGRSLRQGVNLGCAGQVHAGGDERVDLGEQFAIDGRGRSCQRADVQTLDLQVVCGQAGVAGGGTEHDDASGEGFGDGQADLERGLSYGLQHQVHAAGQARDLRGQIGAGAVQDRVGAESFDGAVLGR
ncbi:hypothetical protein GCM10027072_70530 [Streptomyces bullii]